MIPKNPITIILNQWITNKYFDWFHKRYLSTWDYETISEYRNPEKNREVGGVPDSSHQYGLAKDFVLKNKDTGEYLSAQQLEKIHSEFVYPYWEGFSLYEAPRDGFKTGHIHVNLDRDLTKYTWIAGLVAAVGAGAWGIQKLIKIKKP